MTEQIRNLVLVLGDQLSLSMSSLSDADPARDPVLMCEVAEEATYVRHHKKKITLIFSAMRHFADELRDHGFEVRYVKLDDDGNSNSFTGEVKRAVGDLKPERIVVTEPGEWRVRQAMDRWSADFDIPVEIRDDTRFLCSRGDFRQWAGDRRALTMEFFYREMRRRTGLLMDGDKPCGGRWNFDADNRKPASPDLFRPAHSTFSLDAITQSVMKLVNARFPDHMGSADGFAFAVKREDCERAADDFIENFLPDFGETQDAMLKDDPFLNHSLLSFYLNLGLLEPMALCRAAERAYFDGHAPLNAVEGFIRQIIGWREYVRGVYWLFMPDYADSNFFDAKRPLPAFSGRERRRWPVLRR